MRNTINKVSLFLLHNIPSFIFLAIPLFFLTNTIDYFAFNKFYLLNLVASFSLIFWCLQNITNRRISLTLSPGLSALLLLVVVHIFSALFMSPTKALSLTGMTTLFSSLFIIYFTITSTSPSLKTISRQIYVLLFSILILSLFTVLHFFGLSKFLLLTELLDSPHFNFTGGVFAGVSFTIPILFASLVYIYFTSEIKTKIALFLVSGIMITATIVNISLMLPKNGVSPISQLPIGASWSIALDIFKYPGTALIGTGPETYLATFTRLRPSSLNNNSQIWNTRFSESGSLFLTLVTTTGLLGGLSFIFFFLKNITQSLRFFKNVDTENKPLFAFLISALFGYLILFIVSPGGLVSIIIACTLLGVMTQLLKKENYSKIKTLNFNITSDESSNNALSNFLPILTLILSIFLLVTYWSFGIRFYGASVALKQARVKIETDLTGSFLKQQQAQKLNPYDASYSIVISQTYQQVALFYLQKEKPTEQDKQNAIDTMQRAIDAGRIAAKTDPFNVLVWENLSNIYQSFIGSADGATDLAISHLSQAIAVDSTNPKLRLQMGILFYNLGDKEQALKLINQSIDLKPNWEVPYVNLYSIYSVDKDYTRAESNLKQAIALINPSSPDYEKLQIELNKLSERVSPTTQSTDSAFPKL
jgi:tetratricopeptide (TPR) repeat protein